MNGQPPTRRPTGDLRAPPPAGDPCAATADDLARSPRPTTSCTPPLHATPARRPHLLDSGGRFPHLLTLTAARRSAPAPALDSRRRAPSAAAGLYQASPSGNPAHRRGARPPHHAAREGPASIPRRRDPDLPTALQGTVAPPSRIHRTAASRDPPRRRPRDPPRPPPPHLPPLLEHAMAVVRGGTLRALVQCEPPPAARRLGIGRASCRERVYVLV